MPTSDAHLKPTKSGSQGDSSDDPSSCGGVSSPREKRNSLRRLDIQRRILDAVLDLAAEGGYAAVQLREVSSKSNVSLRTIYKYFPSRQILVAAALQEWWSQQIKASTVSGEGFVERVLSIYRHNFQIFMKSPKLLDAFIEIQLELGPEDSSWARDGLRPDLDQELAPFGEEFAKDFYLIVGGVLHQGIRLHGFGLMTLEQVWAQLERTVQRLANSAVDLTANDD